MQQNNVVTHCCWNIAVIEGDELAASSLNISHDSSDRKAYETLLHAYRSAVPPEARVPSDTNWWHVKVFPAVETASKDLNPYEGQLVCRNTHTLTSIYIYARPCEN